MCHGLIPVSCQPRRDGCISHSPLPTPHSLFRIPPPGCTGRWAPCRGDQSCSLRGTTAPAAGRASPSPLAASGGSSTDREHPGPQQRFPAPGRKGRSGDVDVDGDGGRGGSGDGDSSGQAFLPRFPPRYRDTPRRREPTTKPRRDACAGLRRPKSCPAAAAQPCPGGDRGRPEYSAHCRGPAAAHTEHRCSLTPTLSEGGADAVADGTERTVAPRPTQREDSPSLTLVLELVNEILVTPGLSLPRGWSGLGSGSWRVGVGRWPKLSVFKEHLNSVLNNELKFSVSLGRD